VGIETRQVSPATLSALEYSYSRETTFPMNHDILRAAQSMMRSIFSPSTAT